MNIKEAACLLGWKSEQVAAAIGKGVICGKWGKISLRAAKCGTDYEITDSDIDAFLQKFETEEPGRYPCLAVRRKLLIESRYKCAVCEADAPLQFHHIIEWAKLKHHDPKHMLAVCGICHDKIRLGQIDAKAQQEIKSKLGGRGAARRIKAPTVVPTSTAVEDTILDECSGDRIVWCLPRGFLMIEEFAFSRVETWAIVAHYYHERVSPRKMTSIDKTVIFLGLTYGFRQKVLKNSFKAP